MVQMRQVEDGVFVVTDPRFVGPAPSPSVKDLRRLYRAVGLLPALLVVVVIGLAWMCP